MRVAYFVAKLRTFTADVTFRHFILPPVSCKKYLTVNILSYYTKPWQVKI